MSCQKFFFTSEQNLRSFLFCELVLKGIPSIFYLLRNDLERNYEVPSLFSSTKRFRTEFRAFFSSAKWFVAKLQSSECFFTLLQNGLVRNHAFFLSSAEWLGTEFQEFSVSRNRRNSNGMNQNVRLFRVPWKIFFPKNGNPSTEIL